MARRDSIPREALTGFVNDGSKDIFYRGCECDLCTSAEERFFATSERERTYEDLVEAAGAYKKGDMTKAVAIVDEVTRATGIPAEGGDERRKDAGKVPLHLVPWDTIQCFETGLVDNLPDYELKEGCGQYDLTLQPCDALDNLVEFFQNGAELRAPALTSDEVIGVARVLEFGAKKYSARGWEKGIEYSRTFSSGMRHLLALGNGQENDPETGLPHWHHALCNYLFLVRFSHTPGFEKFDDRPLKSEL